MRRTDSRCAAGMFKIPAFTDQIGGKYLLAYTREMAWREDSRRQPNGSLHTMATGAALGHPVSRVWAGYWQRSEKT